MKQNGFIENLYEMAKSNSIDPISGQYKFDEQKLRRELDKNDKLMRNNKDIFMEQEPKYFSCPRYLKCPICSKCQNKASHLYVACQTCKIPICSHTYADREKMIKRKNFTTYVSNDIMNSIKELSRKIVGEQYGNT